MWTVMGRTRWKSYGSSLLIFFFSSLASFGSAHEEVLKTEGRSLLLKTHPKEERVWNFIEGDFDLVQPSEIKIKELPPRNSTLHNEMISENSLRAKRATFSKLRRPKKLDLAVFIDQEMWDLYVQKYGFEDANTRLELFVGVMLNTTKSLYEHSSLKPRLDIKIMKTTIWRNQPRSLKKITTGLDYVDKFCAYVRPKSSGYDHATLITGNRLQVGLDIDGIAWQDSVCTDASCTVVRGAFNTAYRHGNTLAHEMGHSLGMSHDGSGSSRSCSESCCIMAPKQTGTVWSTCSNSQYRRTVLNTQCMDDNTSRRNTKIMDGPVSELPGQVLPDEGQCHQIVGTCYRSVPGREGDCKKHFCTRHKDSSIMTTISEFRLDGSYCGPGKVCEGGDCISLQSSKRSEQREVDGGWSDWRSESEENCGGGECSSCEIKDQKSVQVEVRRCDSPFPNNGGSPCRGSQIRGRVCTGSAAPWNCQRKRNRYDGKMDYMEDVCRKVFRMTPTTGVLYEKGFVGCDFICYNRFLSEEAPKRFPDGTSCGSSSSEGRCVHGVCMTNNCAADPNLFVVNRSDC